MITSIQKWGNSQGIRIPKHLLDEVHISQGDTILLKTDNNKIIIEKLNNNKNIKELFSNYHDEYKCEDIYWGEPKGKEIW